MIPSLTALIIPTVPALISLIPCSYYPYSPLLSCSYYRFGLCSYYPYCPCFYYPNCPGSYCPYFPAHNIRTVPGFFVHKQYPLRLWHWGLDPLWSLFKSSCLAWLWLNTGHSIWRHCSLSLSQVLYPTYTAINRQYTPRFQLCCFSVLSKEKSKRAKGHVLFLLII